MRPARILAVLVLLAVAGCAGSADAGSQAAARYLAIARPANHRLERAVDGYRDASRDDLVRARADLRRQAAVERHFDRRLAGMALPRVPAGIAAAMIRANQARIRLTDQQAASSTLARMRSFDPSHRAADAAVELHVKAIRNALDLPPPPGS